MDEWKEVNCEFLVGDDHATMSASDQKWRNRLLKWAKEYPDEVKIIAINKDGSVTAHIPIDWFRIGKPIQRKPYTEDQKEKFAKILHDARNSVSQA